MSYGLDDSIKEIKKCFRCKNFHYPNIPNIDSIKINDSGFQKIPEDTLPIYKCVDVNIFDINKNYLDAKEFIDDNFLNKNKYYDFIHLTKLSNISSIIEEGSIYSKNTLISKNIKTNCITNNLSHSLNLDNFVHLSIIGDNPMLETFLKRECDNFALILISPLILLYRSFLISNKNTTDRYAKISNYKIIKNILNFEKLYNIKNYPKYDANANSDYKLAQS